MALGDPFELVGGGELGVICVHGFTGTPYEVRYLGEQLAQAGCDVRGLRLPGHGTHPRDLDATRWTDWAAAVEDAFEVMRSRVPRVAVVGQSLGGLLALHLAARRPEVAAVVTLATPLWLEGLAGRVARWAAAGKLPVRWIPKVGGSDVRDRAVKRANPCYRVFPVRALGELAMFMGVVDGELARVTQPLLVLHAHHDHTAPVACATRICEQARPRVVRSRLLAHSYHLIAADVERDIVAEEVIDFLRRYAIVAAGDLACAT